MSGLEDPISVAASPPEAVAETLPIPAALFGRIVEIRRDLHRHPELSWHEERTAERVCGELDRIGIPWRRMLDTGIVAELAGPEDRPIVALRADMDALPIGEETGLPFASVEEGLMHACGHDGHMSMLLGAAHLLAGEELPSRVRLIFQPAEEKGAGAAAMIEAGALEDVGMIFGGHVDRHYNTGQLVVSEGVVNASTDSFKITITGQGAHAARPHESIDAVVVGSLLVMAIQTIVSREVNPAHPSVVSVGKFTAGTASNVISARAILEGTIRAQDSSVRQHLKDSIRRVADAVARLHNAEIAVGLSEGTPRLENTPEMAALAREAGVEIVGADGIAELATANMGAEDFACFLERVPGCYIRFGAQVPGREGFPAHSSKFDFDERALAIGAAWFHRVARLAGRRLGGEGAD